MQLLYAAADLALAPFLALPYWAGVTALSVVLGALLLWVFGALTPQARIAQVRDRMTAAVYEMRLWIDSPRQVLRAQARLFGLTLTYLALATPALIVAAGPVGLLCLRADEVWSVRPLAPGETALVRLSEADAELDLRGAEPDSPWVRGPGEAWVRVKADADGGDLALYAAAGEAKLLLPERQGSAPWWVAVLVLSTLAAFVLKRPLGVAI